MKTLDMNMFHVITAKSSQYGDWGFNVSHAMIMTFAKVNPFLMIDCYDKNLQLPPEEKFHSLEH